MKLTVMEYTDMKNAGKSDKLIGELYGMDMNAMYRFKKANNLIGEFDAKKKESPKETESSETLVQQAPTNQYAQLTDELKQQIMQKSELVDKLQEKIARFEAGVEQYKQALVEERAKYKALEEAFDDVEAENEKLRRELEQQAEHQHLSDENKRLQIGYEALKQALKVVL